MKSVFSKCNFSYRSVATSSFAECPLTFWIPSRISQYLAAFVLPSTFTSPPELPAEKLPHSMMLRPPCFMVGLVFCDDVHCLVYAKQSVLMTKKLDAGLIRS